jgi:hypothetical protein
VVAKAGLRLDIILEEQGYRTIILDNQKGDGGAWLHTWQSARNDYGSWMDRRSEVVGNLIIRYEPNSSDTLEFLSK